MVTLKLDDYIKFDDARPAVQSLADSGHARLMLVCMKAGQALRDHKSASQVMAQFLRGRARFVADGVPREAAAGELVLLEAHRFHRIEAIEDTVILVTMAPHPAREGYPRDQIDRIIPREKPSR
jgi:quercetin dioxygenase-like cupin family protein